MKDFSILYYILYPFLKLDLKDKAIFFLIIIFSLFVILFDLLTLSVLSLVLFNVETSIMSRIDVFLFYLNQNFIKLNYEVFKIVFVVSCLILRNIFFILQDYNVRNYVFKHYNKNSENLFKTYASSDYKTFNSKSIHYYLKNLNKETWYCYLGILFSLLYISIDLIYILTIFITSSFIIDFKITIEFVSLIIFFTMLILLIFKIIKKFGANREEAENNYYRDTLNVLKSYLEIKIYNKINLFTKSYSKYLKKFSNTLILQGVINLIPKALLESIIALTILFYLISEGNININLEFLTIIGFILFRASPVVVRIIQNINLIIFNYPSSKILINEEYNYSKSKNKKEKKVGFAINEILLKNAKFKYGTNTIIKNVNYKFIKNKIYGIYGDSGKGKTTLMMVLSGILKLNSGLLKINKNDFSRYQINWGNKIGFMSQYNIMVDDSLTQSLFLEEKIDKKKINEAKLYLIKFKLKKLIKYLNTSKNNYYSLGGMLSGGEKQRLSIIRTILLGKEILFFDEPTASLDKKNEKIVMNELLKLKKDKIIFVSTHKKDHIKYFDKYLFIN